MEKTIFLFTRHPGRTPADFAEHYITHHAVLGRTLTRCLTGYAVNLNEGEGWPDAVTEHWCPSAMDLLTPLKAYATMADFETVLADDRTMFAGFALYVVDREVEVVAAEPLPFVVGEETGECKTVSMLASADALPPPPPGARRVVDSHVSYRLAYDEALRRMAPVPSDIAVFRMAWGPDGAALGGEDSLLVREYRQIAPPAPGWR